MHEQKLEKRICVERRVANSRRLHFNRLGDWRPRLIVWPEYNGRSKEEFPTAFGAIVDRATEQQWGSIIAIAIQRFVAENALHVTAFERVPPRTWERITSDNAVPCWKRNDTLNLNSEYVNARQEYWHGDPIFLVTPAASLAAVPETIKAPLLDRTNLLPFGIAILDFGIEEAVMEVSFAGHEELFLHLLEEASSGFDHEVVYTDKHFVSHWVIANSAEYGEDWREF